MSFPAARISDLTATGDVITGPGVPTVIIMGLPASVLGDLVSGAVCTGAITTNCSVTVLTGGRPQARVTSMVSGANNQSGAPMTTAIIPPCAVTVLIGG
jgi:hypothetical protein